MPLVLGNINNPAIKSDARFFKKNRSRRFRIRPLTSSEFGLPPEVIMFEQGENGECSEASVVIVRRFATHRVRLPFCCDCMNSLRDDGAIEAFLVLRDIDPSTMRPVRASTPERDQ